MKPPKFIHVVWLTTRVLALGHAAFAQTAQVTGRVSDASS